MSWDKDRSKQRIKAELKKNFQPKITDHGREMDFINLGLEDVRRVKGLHLYADVPNFHDAVQEAGDDLQKQRKLIREASVLRKMQTHLLPESAEQIQFQAARLHYLVYKPYDSESDRVLEALISAITLQSYLYGVFNEVFDDGHEYSGAVGISSGESLIANIGQKGERELISLGTCANLGAKIINGEDSIVITEEVYKLLPDCLKTVFESSESEHGVDTFMASGLRWQNHPELQEELNVKFNAERLKKLTEDYRDDLPLSEMEVSGVEAIIDFDLLTERNSKRISAISIFADLSGFTKRIQNAEEDETLEQEIKNLHIIRQEFHRVIESDYPGSVIQHQGDCVIATVYLPANQDDLSKRCSNALNTAIALQSSMESTLKDNLNIPSLHVAIGMDVGKVIVTRLGLKGSREVVCVGLPVCKAQTLQEASDGKEVRISDKLYDLLEEKKLKKYFSKQGEDWIAHSVTFDRITGDEDREAIKKNSFSATSSEVGVTVLVKSPEVSRSVNSAPWFSSPKVSIIPTRWHTMNPDRWFQECEIAKKRLNEFAIELRDDNRASFSGSIKVLTDNGGSYGPFKITVVYPNNFPDKKAVPKIYLKSHQEVWKNIPESHIEGDFGLCLFVPLICGIDFKKEDSLSVLFDVLCGFLLKQTFFQKDFSEEKFNGKKARWIGSDFPHEMAGLRLALKQAGMKLGRNEPCPCGSGVKAKRCHYDQIWGLVNE